MTQLTPEQISAARQASLDLLFGLAGKLVAGVGKLTELNRQTIHSALAETQAHLQKSLSAKDPLEWGAVQTSVSAPVAEQVQSYSRRLFEIASATHAECAQLALAQGEAYSRRVQTLVDDVVRNAPAGSEAAVAALKSAIVATNTLYETVQKASQQAVEVAQSNFAIAADVTSRNTRRAIERASADTKR